MKGKEKSTMYFDSKMQLAKGDDQFRLGNFAEAQKYYSNALSLRRSLFGSDSGNLCRPTLRLGSSLFQCRILDKSYQYLKEAIRLFKLNRNIVDLGYPYYELGRVCMELSEYEEAIDSFTNSIIFKMSIHEETDEEIIEMIKYLGKAYYNQGKEEYASFYFKKAADIQLSLTFRSNVTRLNNNEGCFADAA